MSDILPNLVIAGVNKAGTTTLFGALAEHHEVAGSDIKETCHWLPTRYGEPQPGLDAYADHFRGAAKLEPRPRIVMEATPGYFYGGARIAPALDDALPGVRIVIVLREPVSRLLSFFRFKKAMLELDADLTADAYVEACLARDRDALLHDRSLNAWFGVEGGCYDRHLPAWTETFGERLRVLFFDDLAADQHGALVDLAEWLGIAADAWDDVDLGADNRTIAPKRRGLHRAAITVNRVMEKQLRRAPAVKRALRGVYGKINAGEATETVSDDGRARLEALYAPHNEALRAQVDALGITPPDWVR